ncbi:hypothetical protein DWG24_16435 [Dickeya zeae]|uniref:Uncharacterized protein n=1 Tax=Dickeya zeae TaxID=204042 RepID=A0AAE7CZX3_9GAMM|nr:hypothetical protein DWG24_16435 [Dickeya zeae]
MTSCHNENLHFLIRFLHKKNEQNKPFHFQFRERKQDRNKIKIKERSRNNDVNKEMRDFNKCKSRQEWKGHIHDKKKKANTE